MGEAKTDSEIHQSRLALKKLKEVASSSQPWDMLPLFHRFMDTVELDYTLGQSLHRVIGLASKRGGELGMGPPYPELRLALLSSGTSTQLLWVLEAYLLKLGLFPVFYESDFGVWRQEVADPDSGLYRFGPRFVILSPIPEDVTFPRIGDSGEVVTNLVNTQVGDWMKFWNILGAAGIHVIQENFVLPFLRPAGSLESTLASAPSHFLSEMNRFFIQSSPSHVTVHDLDRVASFYGKRYWWDERFYVHSKQQCSLEALPLYASSLTGVVSALVGKSKKCLVLDLDNTIWGGVVGDDGVENLLIGQGSPEGEAYIRFQQYVLGLRQRGIVLAICSKNNDAVAREVFECHPEMVLKIEDFACFVCNWEDKAANLRSISRALNLGLDSFVFVDDNPAERDLIRRELPEVAVPDLPEDPSGYAAEIDRHHYFELAMYTQEDSSRTEQYAANARFADEMGKSVSDIESFLISLNMSGSIRSPSPIDVPRAAQLINKSNQFNLTTWRLTQVELERLIDDPKFIVRVVRLRDRFVDHGLISVLIGRVEEDSLEICMWLMSCRVLARGVEVFALNHLFELAKGAGLRRLVGNYIPTPKNGIVRDHYAELGFRQINVSSNFPNGTTRWEIKLSEL